MTLKRIVVLASGSGSNLQALIDAIERGTVPARIAAVISNQDKAGALRRAEEAGIPAIAVPLRDRRDARARHQFDQVLAEKIDAFAPDLVVLAGWMLILGDSVLERFPGRIVNVHPALLPDGPENVIASSCGSLPVLRGAHAVRDALRLKLPLTGATVHVVTSAVDTGSVLLREEVPILDDDDQERLHERIKCVEHALLPRAVAMALEAQISEDHDGQRSTIGHHCARVEVGRRAP